MKKSTLLITAIFVLTLSANGFSADIWQAAKTGDTNTLAKWIERIGVGADITNRNGLTPLFSAVEENRQDAIEYLIQMGADVNFAGPNGITPLIAAVLSENSASVEFLIQSGANISATNAQNKSALSYAVEQADPDIVTLLLENGADTSITFSGQKVDIYTYQIQFNLLEYAVSRFVNRPYDLNTAHTVAVIYDFITDNRLGLSVNKTLPDDMNSLQKMNYYVVWNDIDHITALLQDGVSPDEGTLSPVQLAYSIGRDKITDLFVNYDFYSTGEYDTEFQEASENDLSNWVTYGSAKWYVDDTVSYYNQDVDSLRSGEIDDNQTSSLSVDFEGSSISFYWKSDCYSSGDKLTFYLDGENKASMTGSRYWELKSFEVEPGQHTALWIYSKDGYYSSGSDCGWIDAITVE